jgi:hypothetical protein
MMRSQALRHGRQGAFGGLQNGRSGSELVGAPDLVAGATTSRCADVGPLVGTAQRVTNFLVISMMVRGGLIRQSPPSRSADCAAKTPIVAAPFFKTRACVFYSSVISCPSPALPCCVPCPPKWANSLIVHNMWCGITAPHDRLPGPLRRARPWTFASRGGKNRQGTAHLPRLLNPRSQALPARLCLPNNAPPPRKAPTAASGFPLPLDGPLPPDTAPFGPGSP